MDQHNNKNSIDEIDQRIIEELQMDGRRPFTKIATDLGISAVAILTNSLKNALPALTSQS